jgi:hypothetical protein
MIIFFVLFISNACYAANDKKYMIVQSYVGFCEKPNQYNFPKPLSYCVDNKISHDYMTISMFSDKISSLMNLGWIPVGNFYMEDYGDRGGKFIYQPMTWTN